MALSNSFAICRLERGELLEAIAVFSNGDARIALNTLEMAITNAAVSAGTIHVSKVMPLVTALKLIKAAWVLLAIILARVVLPTPGGPQKIIEDNAIHNPKAFGQTKIDILPELLEAIAVFSNGDAIQHSGEPVDSCIRVAVAHGFVQGGNQVIMFFAVFVI